MVDGTKRPGFRAGFASVLSGFSGLLKKPRAWPFAAVPMAILVVLSTLLAWAAIHGVHVLVSRWVGQPTSWYGQAGATVLSWLGAVLAAVLGLLVALALTPPLSGPALERIVGFEEAELGVPAREPIGFFAEIWCGLRAQAVAAVIAVPILALLWLIELFFSAAVFVTMPLKLVVSAFALAWNLFDYPLTLRGVRMRHRLLMVRQHKAAAFGFGLAFSLLFWLPCFGVLMLPVGVAAATRLVWRILESSPELLPEVPRRSRLG